MTFIEMLQAAQQRNRSMLCVGLDPEPTRFPAGMKDDAARIFDFCARIADATGDLAIAFKPQIAYFAAHRAEEQLERLMRHLRASFPQVPVILDAKRGDIGSTAEQYAREAFDRYGADAVTLSPFMGFDSVQPYLKYPGKGAFLLCRTSNPGRGRPAEPAARVGGRPAAAVRTRRAARAGPVEPQRAAGAGGGRDLSGGDRARARARADRCRC
jgi:orotidine-5'-phosphate decarboxylase